MNSPAELIHDSRKVRRRWMFILLWLCFSLSLLVWQHVFTLKLFELLIQTAAHPKIERWVLMVHLESATLFLSILGGGAGLLISLRKEARRQKQLKEFFASFTHEIKTSIAALQLRSEKTLLQAPKADSLEKLNQELQRLQLQLENSLYLARVDESLFQEELSLSELIQPLTKLGDLQIHLNKEVFLVGDRRAFESIFKNIAYNAVIHGRAQNLWIEIEDNPLLSIKIWDDGIGYTGSIEKLGHAFYRPKASSGSGLGLYILKQLTHQMSGSIEFMNSSPGFTLRIRVPGRIP